MGKPTTEDIRPSFAARAILLTIRAVSRSYGGFSTPEAPTETQAEMVCGERAGLAEYPSMMGGSEVDGARSDGSVFRRISSLILTAAWTRSSAVGNHSSSACLARSKRSCWKHTAVGVVPCCKSSERDGRVG